MTIDFALTVHRNYGTINGVIIAPDQTRRPDVSKPREEPKEPKKKGRPKQGGPIGTRMSIVCSEDYRDWLKDFTEHSSQIAGARKSVAGRDP